MLQSDGKQNRGPKVNEKRADLFKKALLFALEQFDAPKLLGEKSPLATPSFLGEWGVGEARSAEKRGACLQKLLLHCAGQLPAESQQLLQRCYFKREKSADNFTIAFDLAMSERTFYRARETALDQLAQAVLTLARPLGTTAFVAPTEWVGNDELVNQLVGWLEKREAVYLSGPSGMGKTSLGQEIVRRWWQKTGHPPFLFTVRDGVSDNALSFFHQIGRYLQQQTGRSQLWQQLAVSTESHHTFLWELLCSDLSLLSQPLLLCCDEIDLLQEGQEQQAVLLHLCEGLSERVATLFMGQRHLLSVPHPFVVPAFSAEQMEQLWRKNRFPPLTSAEQARILTVTQGRPAILILLGSLLQQGQSLSELCQLILEQQYQQTPLEALLYRTWRKLPLPEKTLLAQLAIFRRPTPRDLWQSEKAALQGLLQRQLLQEDAQGNVGLPSYLHLFVPNRLSIEEKKRLHRHAAIIRLQCGEYTAGLYHLVGAREWSQAVWVWFGHRKIERERGNHTQALPLLEQISADELPSEQERHLLHTVRAELWKDHGQSEKVVEALDNLQTSHPLLQSYTQLLQGASWRDLGQAERAEQFFTQTIDHLLDPAPLQLLQAHSSLSFLYLFHKQDRQKAEEQLWLARLLTQTLSADHAVRELRYQEVIDGLLPLVQTMPPNTPLRYQSRGYFFLGYAYLGLMQFEQAIYYNDLATNCDNQLGDELGVLYNHLNRASIYSRMGAHQEGYGSAWEGWQIAKEKQQHYLQAGYEVAIAEAHYGLGHYDEALHFAQQSLSQEEGEFQGWAQLVCALVAYRQGEWEIAWNWLREAMRHAKANLQKELEGQIGLLSAEFHRRAGDEQQAQITRAQAEQFYTQHGLPVPPLFWPLE